mmetsp:Transcript_11563/g.27120  ORF Transcript_11563/g.27120 Transcript_11563/m.27120 type:complete len:224 (+) Transcript_11563:4377-5048(+)
MAYAAAIVPEESIACALRAADTNATFNVICRISMAKPPCTRGSRDANEGGLISFVQSTSFLRKSRRRYIKLDVNSDADVAIAAPAAPKPPKTLLNKDPPIKIGSRTRFKRLVTIVTFSGVTVFSSPRYAAKPVEATSVGIMPSALHRKYGTARAMTAESVDGGTTNLSTLAGYKSRASEKRPPRMFPRNRLSQTRCFADFQSSLPIASATKGAVIVGRKAARK